MTTSQEKSTVRLSLLGWPRAKIDDHRLRISLEFTPPEGGYNQFLEEEVVLEIASRVLKEGLTSEFRRFEFVVKIDQDLGPFVPYVPVQDERSVGEVVTWKTALKDWIDGCRRRTSYSLVRCFAPQVQIASMEAALTDARNRWHRLNEENPRRYSNLWDADQRLTSIQNSLRQLRIIKATWQVIRWVATTVIATVLALAAIDVIP